MTRTATTVVFDAPSTSNGGGIRAEGKTHTQRERERDRMRRKLIRAVYLGFNGLGFGVFRVVLSLDPTQTKGFTLLISADTMSADFEKSAEMSADFQQCRHSILEQDFVSAFS